MCKYIMVNVDRMIKLFTENYNDVKKLNSITDEYSYNCRMRCKVDGEKMSPAEYAKKYNININPKNEYLLKNHVKICSLYPISRCMKILQYAASLMNMKVSNLRWLDPSAGWGDRLISAIKLNIKEYYGTDPSNCMNPIYQKIIKEMANKQNVYKVKKTSFENHLIWKNDIQLRKFDIVFTSPPFYNKEIYENTKLQSIYNKKTANEWFDKFLIKYILNGFRHLKHNGILILYIESYKDNIFLNKLIKQIPYKYVGFIGYTFDDYKTNKKYNKIRPYYLWKKNSPNILLNKFLGHFGYNPKLDIIPKDKIIKRDKILYMLVGFPGSGKTTFIKKHLSKKLKNYVMINNDEILINHPDFIPGKNYVHKNDNFIIFDKIFQIVLKYQLPFIYDSNCVDINFCSQILQKFKNYKKIIYGIYTDKHIAKERINIRAKKEGRYVPDYFLDKSHKSLKDFIKHCKELKPVDILHIYKNNKTITKIL